MIPSFLKETRELAPFWIAFAGMVLVDLVTKALGPDLVLAPLGTRFDTESTGFFAVLLGLLMGHGVVAHEYVNGHVEFLDGLPTSRGQVFLGKVLACGVALLGLVLGHAASDALMLWVAPVPHQLVSWRPLLIEHLVVGASLWFGLGLGMLLSWLRGLAIGVVVALILIGFIVGTADMTLRGAMPLPDTAFGQLVWNRGVASHPLVPPLFWAVVGTGCMALSGLLFLGPGGRLVARGSTALARLRVVGVVLGSGGLVTLGFFGMLATGVQVGPPEPILVVDVPGPLRVLYLRSAAGVPRLANRLDEAFEQIGDRLATELPEGPLDVEFLGAQDNHAGVFTGGKVRVELSADESVLVHELTHAIAHERLGAAGWHQMQHTRFFGEGLANWMADELLGDGKDPPDAFLTYATGQARFDLLVEDDQLVAKQDIVQAYHLGEVFVRALVDVAGEPVLPCVLDALGGFGRQPIAGLALWYDTAAQCGFDLDQVTARWRERLAEGAEGLTLPDLRVELGNDDELRQVLFVRDPSNETDRFCRFRSDPGMPVEFYRHSQVDQQSACFIPFEELSGPTYDYQVGFRSYETAEPAQVYLPWVTDVPFPDGD